MDKMKNLISFAMYRSISGFVLLAGFILSFQLPYFDVVMPVGVNQATGLSNLILSTFNSNLVASAKNYISVSSFFLFLFLCIIYLAFRKRLESFAYVLASLIAVAAVCLACSLFIEVLLSGQSVKFVILWHTLGWGYFISTLLSFVTVIWIYINVRQSKE
ncbi:hypothetical protein [Lactococcus fujiensis]|nr:hypothetical protein [Lactococcus fujiensis]